MINVKALKLIESFRKHFSYLEEYGFEERESREDFFYAQTLFVNEQSSTVISIYYELKENYLSVSAWQMIDEKSWDMKNDLYSTSLSMILNKEGKSQKKLPDYTLLNKKVFDQYTSNYAKLFKQFVPRISDFYLIYSKK